MPLLVFDPKQAQGVDTGLFVGDLMLEHIQYYDGITSAGRSPSGWQTDRILNQARGSDAATDAEAPGGTHCFRACGGITPE